MASVMGFSTRKWRLKIIIWLVALCYLLAFMFYCYGFLHLNLHLKKGTMAQLPSVENSLRLLQLYHQQAIPDIASNDTYGKGLGFLKVHKAASTTAQSIFLRYGWRRNMTFILPHENNKFAYPNIISIEESLTASNILPPPPNRSHEILCHHVLYDRQAWNKHLPAHAPKIGTIRHPFDVFQSALRYFRPDTISKINSDDPVKTFLQNPLDYDGGDARFSFLNNRMAVEYGVDPEIIRKRDIARFEKYMYGVLDKDFAVVIIAEMFDESLVLTKRKLGWSLNDILYFPQNLHISWKDIGVRTGHPIEEIKQLHKRFAIFDYILYDFFKKRLFKQVSKENQFEEEVQHFRKVRTEVGKFCFQKGVPVYRLVKFDQVNIYESLTSQTMTVNATVWNERFEISKLDCHFMFRDEIDFTQLIRKRQYGKAVWGHLSVV